MNQVEHVYFKQTINGIEIFGTQSSIHILSNGNLLTANHHFINKIEGSTSPSLTATQAVESAANQLNYTLTEALTANQITAGKANQQTIISSGGISLSNIPAKLMYTLVEDKLILVWNISIQEITQQDWWNIQVDASTGVIISKNNWIVSCANDHDHNTDEVLNYNKNLFDIPNYNKPSENTGGCNDCYEVFAMPLESPLYGNRTIETLPHNVIASPFGWHDTDGVVGAEFNDTQGNNVDAFEDAAITNLFYWNNITHDVLYTYGFDEAAGNFQVNNYGNGGLGNDSVDAEGQKGETCNAFFGTPSDGSSPTMQMYVCTGRDGDFDNLVIIHEYCHGLSNRLTGVVMM